MVKNDFSNLIYTLEKNKNPLKIMLKSYKYRIYPSDEQKEQMTKIFGCVRFVYNLGLETKIQAYTAARVNIDCFTLNKQITDLKKDIPWLSDAPAQSLQASVANLDNAYTNFFRGLGFPKFKNRYSKQSFSVPQGVSIDYIKGKVFIPKIKNMDIIIDRKFEGAIKTVTVSKTITNKYFVSILVDNQVELPIKASIKEETALGIDFGIKDLAILSDGTKVTNPKYLKQAQSRLRVEQRKLARKCKPKAKEQSKGYLKQKLVVAKLHEKIRNQRLDYLHKLTTSITKKYETIIIEDLNVSGMIKNRKLAKAIADVSWYELKRQLVYKSEWCGRNLLLIGRFDPSSKTCSSCGKINKELTLKDREWSCGCGVKHDRDHNAAKNIKHFGLRNIKGFRVEPSDVKAVQ
jgi:putative transposase